MRKPPSIGDIGRWIFWGPFRHTLSPNRPRQIRVLREAWRAQWLGSGKQHGLMIEELERCFPSANAQALIPKAYARLNSQEPLLGKVNAQTIDHYIQVDGIIHLEQAMANQNGVLLLYPHAGPVMLMMAWLAHHGYPYVQYAARGLPPAEMAEAHPELLASNWFRERTRQSREAAEDALPVEFVTLDRVYAHSSEPSKKKSWPSLLMVE